MVINPISKSRLAGVPEALSRPLFVAARPRSLKAGGVLFAAGDAGDGCYLLDVGFGNSATPINDGLCCDDCERFVVTPARVRSIMATRGGFVAARN
jgi:hypothetical protein